MQIDLTGQAILVTGASGGIGRQIATSLAQSGASVAVHFHKSESRANDVLKSCGKSSFLVQANLEDPDQVEGLFTEVTSRVARLTGLVNNAGIAIESPPGNPAWLEHWQRTMDINVQAAAQLSMLAVDHFTIRGGGRLVHMSSRAAHRGDTADYLAYGASKGALLTLSKSLARAYGKSNIRSFAIAPGFVDTDMAKDFVERYGEAHVTEGMVMEQLTQPEHIAPLCTLVFSGLMDHANGATFDMNGGSYIR